MPRKLLLMMWVASVAACGDPHFTEPLTLAGKVVPAQTLEAGRIVYMRYCRQCHGDGGDGKGPAAFSLRPQPRDFRSAEFKFAMVPNGQLPTDEDLKHTIRNGLAGTAMLPWDISDNELESVVQYIKTFDGVDKEGTPKPSKWARKKKTGEPIEMSADPWGEAKKAEAIARGKTVYHVKAMCAGCHPFYASLKEVYDMSMAEAGKDDGMTPIVRELRPHAFLPELKASPAYGSILPPDFTFRVLRSGNEYKDLYRSIAAGIGGTAMPRWKGVLAEAELWAMVYYVKYLTDLRDTAESRELRMRIVSAPPFTPPAEGAEPTPEAPAEAPAEVVPASAAPGAGPAKAAPAKAAPAPAPAKTLERSRIKALPAQAAPINAMQPKKDPAPPVAPVAQ